MENHPTTEAAAAAAPRVVTPGELQYWQERVADARARMAKVGRTAEFEAAFKLRRRTGLDWPEAARLACEDAIFGAPQSP